MRVDRDGDDWIVIDDSGRVQGRFSTSAAAWRHVDRAESQPISPAEKRTDYVVGKIIRRVPPSAARKPTVRSDRTAGRAPRDNEAFVWTEGLHPLRDWLAGKLVDVSSIKTARQALWLAKSLGKLKAPMPKKGREVFPALMAGQKALCGRQTRPHTPAVATRDYKLGTHGPASEVRRIDPATYKIGGAA